MKVEIRNVSNLLNLKVIRLSNVQHAVFRILPYFQWSFPCMYPQLSLMTRNMKMRQYLVDFLFKILSSYE